MSKGYQIRDQFAIHFVTFTVVNWIDLFIRDVYRDIVVDGLRYCQIHKGLKIHARVIMTNHLHLIISCNEGCLLSNVIRDVKKFTAVALIREIQNNPRESRRVWMMNLLRSAGERNSRNSCHQVWQQDNHPVELSTNTMIDQRLDYLHKNPVKGGFVRNPEDYMYSSAWAYHNGNEGILEIDFLH